MIGPVYSFVEMHPNSFEVGSFVHILEFGETRHHTFIAKVLKHSDYFGCTIFADENGYTFRVRYSDTIKVVTNIEDWDTMSDDTRMDIELDLMTRGL